MWPIRISKWLVKNTDFWALSLESLIVFNLTDFPGDDDAANLAQGRWEPQP